MSAKVAPANSHPCAECPWRTVNQGQRHPHGFYSKANLRRLWAGLRRGERMSCHPTDSRMAEFEGYEHTAEVETTHECMGALVLVQREAQKFQDIVAEFGWAEGSMLYRRRHPMGLTREGLAATVERVIFAGSPLSSAVRANLNEDGIDYAPLGSWGARLS